MYPFSQFLIGMAAAGLAVGPRHPMSLVAGALVGVLPDVMDWWLHHGWRRPHITVTPDPLNPDAAQLAAQMADGLRQALHHAAVTGRTCIVRFNPLPRTYLEIGGRDGARPSNHERTEHLLPFWRAGLRPGRLGFDLEIGTNKNGSFQTYAIDRDPQHRLCVVLGARRAEVQDAAAANFFAPLHGLPLPIKIQPVDLLLQPSPNRIECRDLAALNDLGHSIPVAALLTVSVALVNATFGIAIAAALAAHLLLDAGGRREMRPWLPFSHRIYFARRLWNDCGWRANISAILLAAAILAALVCCK